MSGRRVRRERRSAEKRDRSDSLEDSSTSTPIDSTDIPEDVIQDSKLSPVQEPVVTAAAASTRQTSPENKAILIAIVIIRT